jgi:hypothetical protein
MEKRDNSDSLIHCLVIDSPVGYATPVMAKYDFFYPVLHRYTQSLIGHGYLA